MASVRLACRSRLIAIGRSGAIDLILRRSSPSPSARDSVTIAPCKSRKQTSHPLEIDSQIAFVMALYASLSTGPLGAAFPAIGVANSMSADRAISTKAPKPVPVPSKLFRASFPQGTSIPFVPNLEKGVGTGENVFVSCCIIAITARIPEVINFAIVHSLVRYPREDATEET